jgi:hypothetical protein
MWLCLGIEYEIKCRNVYIVHLCAQVQTKFYIVN